MTFPRSDSGFTLVEALVALLIISLALAGVLQTARFVAHLNSRVVVADRAEKAAVQMKHDVALQLLPVQPIMGDDLVGDAAHIQVRCPEAMPGTHDCTVASTPGLSFAYISQGQVLKQWPQAPVTPDTAPVRLEAVLIRNAVGKNIAVIPLPVEHNRNCAFDMVSRTCRTVVPDSSGE